METSFMGIPLTKKPDTRLDGALAVLLNPMGFPRRLISCLLALTNTPKKIRQPATAATARLWAGRVTDRPSRPWATLPQLERQPGAYPGHYRRHGQPRWGRRADPRQRVRLASAFRRQGTKIC